MKKKSLKSLKLTKNTISNFKRSVTGGLQEAQSEILSCLPPPPPPVTQPYTGCQDTVNNWCDSRFGGCPTYYCPTDQ
ncbi:hypothetical protein C8N46_102407 [Kordia periserrulae]|uniref:Uncharacterized protein n=1 Tax=Kordia periserrulae TaxID=701523 RepID=A0A2T6C3V1_9FLAO|nr:hypothetical protein [Kordia periserrulae]PTX63006.1 hypothetical protein C8N46_102407 [Kordia periserrulae]